MNEEGVNYADKKGKKDVCSVARCL